MYVLEILGQTHQKKLKNNDFETQESEEDGSPEKMLYKTQK